MSCMFNSLDRDVRAGFEACLGDNLEFLYLFLDTEGYKIFVDFNS